MKFIFFLFLLLSNYLSFGQTLTDPLEFKKPSNRILIISGGGARGAWGVGVCKALLRKHKGYRAVYGTSTGSIMAGMVYLQKIDIVERNYLKVDRYSIFNWDPFNIYFKSFTPKKFDPVTGKEIKIVDADFRILDANLARIMPPHWGNGLVNRIKNGKSTIGESENLLKLLESQFDSRNYDTLQYLTRKYAGEVGLGVTCMEKAKFKTILNSDCDWRRFVNCMWASANQPLLMSYYYDKVDNATYVDGGLFELIPITEALNFAKKNNIDTIDIILNNSLSSVDTTKFDRNGNIMSGLSRILESYGEVTLEANLEKLKLMQKIDSLERVISNKDSKSNGKIEINFYTMNNELADTYRQSLAFDSDLMTILLYRGFCEGVEKLDIENLLTDSEMEMYKKYKDNIKMKMSKDSIYKNK